MVEAAHGVNFGGGKLAGDEPRECEGDVGGVFTADEDGVGAVKLVVGDGEAFAGFEAPGVEGADEFVLAVAEIAGDDEAEIVGGVGAAVMLANVFQFNVTDGAETLLEVGDVFADLLLETRPEQAGVIVEIAGEFGADVPFFAAELVFVKAGLGDGIALEFKNAVPLKISAFAFIADGVIGGPGVVVGAVFGEISFKGLFAAVFGVGAEGEVFNHVGDFVNFGALGIAHTGAELELSAHHAGAGDVNQ